MNFPQIYKLEPHYQIMGLIRGGIVFFMCLLLLVGVLVFGFFTTLSFSLDIDNVRNSLDESELNVLNESIEEIYYKDYECSFGECWENLDGEAPWFLVSEMSKDYFSGLARVFATISLVLIALSLIFLNKRTDVFLYSGIVILIAALPFFWIDKLAVLANLPFEVLSFTAVLFSSGAK